MNRKVAIIDYGVGNLTSVKNAFDELGVIAEIVDKPERLNDATHVVLPGVGSFEAGMRGLRDADFVDALKEVVEKNKKPILGICLGMQLFATVGEENGEHCGLDFIYGKVSLIDVAESKLPLPHIGWNDVDIMNDSVLGSGFESVPQFYFVHSYHFVPKDTSVIVGKADYGVPVTAMVEKENIFGAQFHPEKSHIDGVQIFKNFLDYA